MAIAPHPVEWRPLPENETQPSAEMRVTILHSIVGSAESAYGHFLNSTKLESHFIIRKNGDILQLINTDRTADANYKATVFSISIETEDNRDPDTDPWTIEQIESILWLLEWILKSHPKMTRTECLDAFGTGLGYHTKFGAPSAWTPVSKTCPGMVRIDQFYTVILPRFLHGTTTKPEPTDPLRDEVNMLLYFDKVNNKIYLERGGNVTNITAFSDEFWALAGPGRIPVVTVSRAFITVLSNDVLRVDPVD